MPLPTLVIVTGPPGAGKTTLAQRIGRDCALPVFSKDALKETLFDALGWSDLAWSRRVGVASVALLFAIAEAQLAAGHSLVIESNFRPEFDTPRALDLLRRIPCEAAQLVCEAAPAVLLRRFRERLDSGARHPGHLERQQLDDFAATHLSGAYTPLAIGGRTLTVETSDFAAVEYAGILAWVSQALRGASRETT